MRSVVQRAIDVVTRATKWLTIFATVCIAIMMVIIVIDIVSSKWFDWSLPGTLDFSEELMVFLTLLPVAYVALERGHIRITLLEEHMPRTGRFSLRLLRYTVGMLIMGFLTWRTFTQFQHALETMQVKEGINWPTWPANLAVVLAFGFLALVYLLLLTKTLTPGLEK